MWARCVYKIFVEIIQIHQLLFLKFAIGYNFTNRQSSWIYFNFYLIKLFSINFFEICNGVKKRIYFYQFGIHVLLNIIEKVLCYILELLEFIGFCKYVLIVWMFIILSWIIPNIYDHTIVVSTIIQSYVDTINIYGPSKIKQLEACTFVTKPKKLKYR